MEKLGINFPVFLAQLINFLMLLAILYFVAYKPVLRMLSERSDRIKESMNQAEEIKRKMAKIDEDVKLAIDKARQEGQLLINKASQIGDRVKEEAKDEAKAEAQKLIEKARAEINRERDQSISELKKEFAEIAIIAAEKVISESLDRQKHERIINEVLKQNTTFGEKK